MVKKKYTEEERVARARAMRREGYNCAQCVILAFDDLLPSESVDTAVLAAQGFGSGYGGRGYVCGAVSGTNMVLGLTGSRPRPELYRLTGGIIDDFIAMEGAVDCSDLKKPGRKPCIDLISDAVVILHRRIEGIV
ncbi:MAG: C-GCAxxG-C-C family protein [Duncaniella sp.]|nr:C-GCAxxG-C-C family protein [Duncaniella sp.]